MRRMTYFVMALVLMLGFTQCKKEQIEPQIEGNGVRISLNVSNGNNGSKADVDPYDSPMVTFKNGDRILVAYNGKYVGYLQHNGTYFSGTIDATGDNTKPLYFYFLGNCVDVTGLEAGTTTSCEAIISDQTGYPVMPVISFSASKENYHGEGSYTASLHNKCGLVKFSTNVPNSTVSVAGMNTVATVNFGTGEITSGTTGTINFATDEKGEGWAILLKQSAVDGAYVTASGDKYGTCDVPEITNNLYYSTGVSISLATCNYVDIGLSVLWATCNIGANSPEEYGGYYAYGETSTKTDYSWSTYKYCEGSNKTLTKYCDKADYGYEGFTDDLTVLEASDDVATANYGNGWRTPTNAEWTELINTIYDNENYTWTWCDGTTTQYNGTTVKGLMITRNSTNATIFFPKSGYKSYTSVQYDGIAGNYMSSSIQEGYPDYFWGFYFNVSSNFQKKTSVGSRCNGRPVRPVRNK